MTHAPGRTLSELQQQLRETRQQLLAMKKRRMKLIRVIEELDRQMFALAFRKDPPRPRRKRYKNETTQRELVPRILKRHRAGLTLAELSKKVQETGYRTHSKSMGFVVYQTLYRLPGVERDSDGRYQLRKAEG